MSAEELIYQLYFFYKVNNNLDLAVKMSTTPQTISNWKTRNSVNAIKKKCRELGIYNEIFQQNLQQDYQYVEYDYNNLSESEKYYVQQQKEVETNKKRQSLICQEVLKMNTTIISSFISVYQKFEKEGKLKELNKILGELEFD